MSLRCVALLRGINVGGKNLVSMADLRDVFTDAGFVGVQTYIQSGNVVFQTDTPRRTLEPSIEQLLAEELGCAVMVVVRSHRQMTNLVASAPERFGSGRAEYLYDVVFLKEPLTSAQAMRVVSLREGVDRAWAGRGALYFARLAERKAQSRFSKLVGTPQYQQMTIRNWSTTTKLLDMLDGHRI